MAKTNISSYNSRIGVTGRQFVIPSLAQIALYVVISGLLLVALNARNIWSYFQDNILIPRINVETPEPASSNPFDRVWHFITHGAWIQIVFWIIVGCGVYIVIWFINNALSNIRNDIIADEYQHPSNYSHFKFWESVVARKFFFGLNVVVFAAFVLISLRVMNLLAQIAYSEIVDFSWQNSTPIIVTSVLGGAAVIYLLILLGHITANSWQYISKDL